MGVSMALLQVQLSGCHMDTLSVSAATQKRDDHEMIKYHKENTKAEPTSVVKEQNQFI